MGNWTLGPFPGTDAFDECQVGGEYKTTVMSFIPGHFPITIYSHTHKQTDPEGSSPVVILITLLYSLYFSRPHYLPF